MKIKLTSFSLRHFNKDFGGTKILNMTPSKFEDHINEFIHLNELRLNEYNLINGYADFCKLLIIPNITDARVGSLPITLENYQYLRSGYSSRRDGELPVFSRWFELPLGKPRAKWLIIVLYSNEQLKKEALENPEHNEIYDFESDWGVVAILGQMEPDEEPMKPETMLRNALGIKEGGSGVPLDRDKYLKSVEFWETHATVK